MCYVQTSLNHLLEQSLHHLPRQPTQVSNHPSSAEISSDVQPKSALV